METKTILIVDDALTNRVLLKRYLEDDYNIIEAENGQRAIDIIDEQQLNISLILLDLIMPENPDLMYLSLCQIMALYLKYRLLL